MVKIWPRNEVLDAVLPLTLAGSRRELTPALVAQLAGTVRQAHPLRAAYATWVAEAWRFLQWAEPQAKLFWEMLTLVTPPLAAAAGGGGGGGEPWGVARQTVPTAALAAFLLLHVAEGRHPHHGQQEKMQAFNTLWVTPDGSPGPGSAPPLSPTRSSPARGGGPFSPKGAGSTATFGSPRMAYSPTRTPPMSPSAKLRGGSPLSPCGGGGGGSGSPAAAGAVAAAAAGSPSASRQHRLFARATEEAERLRFLKRHLTELLLLAAGTAAAAAAGTAAAAAAAAPGDAAALRARPLAAAELDQLGFLFGAARPGPGRPVPKLSELAGDLFSSGSSNIYEVREWLMGVLSLNEVLYPPPPAPTGESFTAAGDGEGGVFEQPWQQEKAKAQALSKADEGIYPEPAPLVYNFVIRTTVMHDEDTKQDELGGENSNSRQLRAVHVNHCHDSYIYLLGAFKSATVLGCTDCTVVIGAISGMVNVVECERIQLVTCCRRLVINNCLDSVFPTLAAAPPVLHGDHRACRLAPPNHAGYPALAAHLRRAGLPDGTAPATVNFWNAPVDLNQAGLASAATAGVGAGAEEEGGGGGGAAAAAPGAALLLPPDQFYSLAVPQPAGAGEPLAAGAPLAPACALPAPYRRQLAERAAAARRAQRRVREAALPPAQAREVEEAVRAQFSEWLIASGNLRQVLDLVQMEKNAASAGFAGPTLTPQKK